MNIICDWCDAPMKEIGHEYRSTYIYKCTKCHHEKPVVIFKDKENEKKKHKTKV